MIGLFAGLGAFVDEPEVAVESANPERMTPDPVYFEERVLPLFAANCGTSGCHGSPGSGRLLLSRPDFQGRYSAEAARKNYDLALEFVAYGKPMESRLLLKPLREKDGGLPHTGKQYDFTRKSEEYALLANWINGVELRDVAPIADAGPDRSGKRGQEIVLDGTASRERRGGELAFRWSIEAKPEGSAPLLKHADTATPALRADRDGAYLLSLVVDNGSRSSEPVTTTVVIDSAPFVAIEGEDAAIESGFFAVRDGEANEGKALAPAQGISVEKPGSAVFAFTLPRQGAYRAYARIANTSDASPSHPLQFSFDGALAAPVPTESGVGYRILELPIPSGDGRLADSRAYVRGGEVAVRSGEIHLVGEEALPARIDLSGDTTNAWLDVTLSFDAPEQGMAHASACYLGLGTGDGPKLLAGLELGRSRCVIRDPAGKVLAEQRVPLRPELPIRLLLETKDGTPSLSVFVSESADPVVLTAPTVVGGVLSLSAVGGVSVRQASYKFALEPKQTLAFTSDVIPNGHLLAGEHSLRFTCDSLDAPRLDQVFLTPRDLGGSGTRDREIRALYLDLLGRTPTLLERKMAYAITREHLIDRLLGSVEFYENVYELELYYFLLLDNFHPRTPQLEALPSRLLNGATDWRDATREIVISQYFNARNPGNDTFVTVILEQLLGITVQDQPALLETGKKMYDGYKTTVFGKSGASQSDLVGIVLERPEFAERFIARHYQRFVGSAPSKTDLERDAERFRADPRSYPALVRDWLSSEAYAQARQTPRAKDDFQWIRSVFVDLLGRRPSDDEFRNFRNAVQALADSRPLRSVLSKVILDSGQVPLPAEEGLKARAFINETFDRFLGRAPTEQEAAAFEKALAEPTVSPRTMVQAILSSAEYQQY